MKTPAERNRRRGAAPSSHHSGETHDLDVTKPIGFDGEAAMGVRMDVVRTGGRKFGSPRVSVLGGFEVRVDERALAFPFHAQRVIAYLAITGASEQRDHLAGRLWPFGTQQRAGANLRSALWRIGSKTASLIDTTRSHVALNPEVIVDCRVADAEARALVGRQVAPCHPPARDWQYELLPGWDEDWLMIERERLRQLRIHALEALSRICLEQGRLFDAIDVALTAVSLEPLRESAQAVLMEAYLAEGNATEAHRQFAAYRSLLQRELGIEPSLQLRKLVTSGDPPCVTGLLD